MNWDYDPGRLTRAWARVGIKANLERIYANIEILRLHYAKAPIPDKIRHRMMESTSILIRCSSCAWAMRVRQIGRADEFFAGHLRKAHAGLVQPGMTREQVTKAGYPYLVNPAGDNQGRSRIADSPTRIQSMKKGRSCR